MLTRTTLSGNQGRLRSPPEAARAEGNAKNADLLMQPSRAAHLSAWPHDSSEGEAMHVRCGCHPP
jgi:hypothetical protein